MTTTVTAPAAPLPAAAPSASPIVMIDDAAEPGLTVLSYAATAPLDAREAVCGVNDPALWERRYLLLNRPATMALPHTLADGTPRWEVLVTGSLREVSRRLRSGEDERTLQLADRWALRLRDTVGTAWKLTSAGLMPTVGQLGIGDRANRSRDRHLVNGRSVYVLEDAGTAWTVGDALDTLAAFADIAVDIGQVPERVRQAELGSAVDFDGALGDVLRRLLGMAGLRVRAERWRAGGDERAVELVVPADVGRRFVLPWGDPSSGVSRVLRTELAVRDEPPRRWVLRGARPAVEATFGLVPGWDPSLAGGPDADYGRTTSSDFSRFGAVYRRWVLNEDGAFTAPPFSRGPAYDLPALFDDAQVVPRPLRFETCLTRDPSGRRLAPVVEVSTDGGAAWSRYEGSAELLTDRAGVVLADATLPAGVLAAAQSGQLRMRVTATLRSPRAIETARWRGNPFVGPGPDHITEVGDAYRWRRVDASSIHANAIDLGELDADEVDDRARLRDALLDQMASAAGSSAAGEVGLAGAWPGIAVGDRLLDLGGPGVNASGVPTSIEERPGRVAEVRVRFGNDGGPRTDLTVESGG